MLTQKLFDEAHQWYVFGRDPEKPEKIIDTNQYMIADGPHVLLIDPGGIELFASMLTSVLKLVDAEHITDLFASHQDPDIISSLGMWDQVLPKAILHGPWMWESFLRHFGMENITYDGIPDEGATFKLGQTELQFVPAHYLHSSGNFHVYDPRAKIYFSGDIGAALEPGQPSLFVEDFNAHVAFMEGFHRRWMPSNRAKDEWIARVRKLDIEVLAPQHGRIFRGDDVGRFLDWFEKLEVGVTG